MGQMTEVFLDGLYPFVCIGIDRMSLGVYGGAKLYDELLEAKKIEFLRFSLIKELDIKVSNKRLNFLLCCEKEQFEIFQELNQFNNFQSLVSFFVFLKVGGSFCGVHATGILEKDCPKNSMVSFEQVINVFDISCLHHLWRVQLKLLLVFFNKL